jgi:hypothetical protein
VPVLDARIQRDDEYSDSEDEGEGGRRDRKSHQKSATPSTTAPTRASSSKSTTPAVLSSLAPAPAPPLPTQPEVTTEEIEAMERELLEEEAAATEEKPARATTSAARATTEASTGEDNGVGITVGAATSMPELVAELIPSIAPTPAVGTVSEDIVMSEVADEGVAAEVKLS